MYRESSDFLRRRISQLASQKGISEYELSYALGKNKNYIRKITCEGSLPSMGAFFEICDYFGITPQEFFDTDKDSPLIIHSLNGMLIKLEHEELELMQQVLERYLKKVDSLKNKSGK